MISVNLLPNSRLERIHAAKRQRSVATLSVLAIIAGVALPIILVIVWLGQRGILALTQRSIDRQVGELRAVENLDEILTVQNKLNSLPTLNQQRLYNSTFLTLLPKLLPPRVSLTEIGISESGTVRLAGKAPSTSPIEDFIAILRRTELFQGDQSRLAFSNVVPINITPSNENPATFELSFSIDNVLNRERFDEGLRIASKVIKESTQSQPAPQANPNPTTP
jgi:Tfp pilus assembly protein PilN